MGESDITMGIADDVKVNMARILLIAPLGAAMLLGTKIAGRACGTTVYLSSGDVNGHYVT